MLAKQPGSFLWKKNVPNVFLAALLIPITIYVFTDHAAGGGYHNSDSPGDSGGLLSVSVEGVCYDRTDGLRRDNAPKINMVKPWKFFAII
jgi:hypothetical protein